jgi:hypothetical protein
MWKLAMTLAGAVLLHAAPASAQSGSQVHFKAGDLGLSMPLPEHYCIPTGAEAELAAFAANLGGNPTVATLPSCGPDKSGQDYYIIKWMASLGAVDLTLDQLLGREFDRSRTPIPVPATEKEVSDALTARTGRPISMTVEIAPDGRDETCGYVSGVATADSGGEALQMTMVACIAIIGKRALEVIRYVPGNAPERIPELKRVVREIAATIRPDPGAAK